VTLYGESMEDCQELEALALTAYCYAMS